jgi:uncharacterized protein (DUF1778 family)
MTTRKTSRTAATRRAATRDERIDFRVNPDTKDLLVRAAALRGSNLTAFILESAQERAVELIEQYERLNLTSRDRDRLLGALTEPPRPVAALRRLFQKQTTRTR